MANRKPLVGTYKIWLELLRHETMHEWDRDPEDIGPPWEKFYEAGLSVAEAFSIAKGRFCDVRQSGVVSKRKQI